MFVGVQMRWGQAGVDNPLDLSRQLSIDINLAERHGADELRDGPGKSGCPYQDQVTADIERGSFAGQSYGVVKSVAGSHQRGGGQNAVAMRLDNAGVDVPSEAEVIGVDD